MRIVARLTAALTAVATGAVMSAWVGLPAVAAPLDPAGGLRFDFGSETSPVADGYRQVTNTMLYTSERGYGLDRVVAFRDRGGPDPLRRDFTLAATYGFAVDVASGDYYVSVLSGDASASNTTTVAAEGVARGSVTSTAGKYGTVAALVTVSDGQLNLDFGRDGRVNAVELVPVPAPTGLHLTGRTATLTPSVSLAWTAVPGAARYRVYRAGTTDGPFSMVGEPTSASYTDGAVELGLSYVYAVSQVNGTGIESARTPTLAVTVRDEAVHAPAVPRDAAVERTTTDAVSLRWSPTARTLRFYVYRAVSADGPYTKIATVTDRLYTDPTAPGRNFFYQVYAVNAGGLSPASTVVKSPVTRRPPRPMERLDRALVAVPSQGGELVSWRLLGTDPTDVTFHLYRDGALISTVGPTSATNILDATGTAESSYTVAAVIGGREADRSAPVRPWGSDHLDVPLQRPAGGTTPDGKSYTYNANDVSVGDVDGDGQYELIVKWDPSNSRDNSQAGYTGEVFLDAYTFTGTRLWRISMGRNIRAGAHYTQFMVYDLDGDGRAEVAARTSDGTTDGVGTVIGDASADYRTTTGYVLSGPEFLTVFNGATGAAMTSIPYEPARGDVCDWGDCYGNRVDRFLAGIAYLDGERPSLIMARGYYTRTVLVAYDWRDGKLTRRWMFDSTTIGVGGYSGQGNHQLSVADIDNDGKDEIVYGAMAVDDDGTPLWTTNLGHGDALHVGDLDPSRPGLEVFDVHEDKTAKYGLELRDAATGKIYWGQFTGIDTGRGLSADIDPSHPGEEMWAIDGSWDSPTGSLYAASGERISTRIPGANFAIWWDGDLGREILDHVFDPVAGVGVGTIGKWDPATSQTVNLLTATGTFSNNYTKGTPAIQADLFGDWREEVAWRTEDSSALRFFATTTPTQYRIPTLMHDPVYRLGVAWQNVAYNQPPHPSFFLGTGMAPPPVPHIRTGPALSATVHIEPSVWLAGSGWRLPVLAAVTLPVGPESAPVATGTIRLLVDGRLVEPRATTVTSDLHGRRLLLITFDGSDLASSVRDYGGQLALSITGHLTDGRTFAGSDSIYVLGPAH